MLNNIFLYARYTSLKASREGGLIMSKIEMILNVLTEHVTMTNSRRAHILAYAGFTEKFEKF